MGLFLACTSLETAVPLAWYPSIYSLKILVVFVALMVCRVPWADLRPSSRVILPSAVVGLLVFACWVGIEKLVAYPRPQARIGFNPFGNTIPYAWGQYAFVAIRLFGLALVVPVMEELFWRSFLLRYLTHADFKALPVGEYSRSAFVLVAALFAMGHPEWLPAIVTACAYAMLLRRTGSVFAAVVAHAVTNGALGAYILIARDWMFW